MARERTRHVVTLIVTLSLLAAPESDAQGVEFFETKIRPALVEHCHSCHSQDAKRIRAGLRVDSREALLEGGDSGPAIVPGKPDESPLVLAVRYLSQDLEMPPDGKLPGRTIEAFTEWVRMGAPWPAKKSEGRAVKAGEAGYDWQRFGREHWAFQPVKNPALPEVSDMSWPLNPIDYFVLARLEAAAMMPASAADRRAWIRRVYLALIGLVPTPEQVERFLNDSSEVAYETVIDRLLASPQYGERWARHWLDVARYNDGYGVGYDGGMRPGAHYYRDWVVRVLNEDRPFDEFVRQQIAGDLLTRGEFGTGFLAVGPKYGSDGGDPQSIADARAETLEDRMDTTFRGFMALTIACARCHDHKFDPIPTADYYSIAGVFNNTTPMAELPQAPESVVKLWRDKKASIEAQDRAVGKAHRELRKLKGEAREPKLKEIKELEKVRDRLKEELPLKYPYAHVVADSGATDMPVALRGNLRKPGEVVPRRFLRILAGEERRRWTEGSGRLDLARAISSRDNPLTPRVFVNRVWMHHFGHGLVRTPSNFGILGEKPTHPLLLDWLASYFMDNGWSIKKLHRVILLSAAYRMSSAHNDPHFQRDSENRLFWRMSPRRLEVEAWRDALLSVTGEIELGLGGEPTKELMMTARRTVYSVVSRNGDRFESDQFLRLFDFPAARITNEQRVVSTVPQQFLFLLNSEFMVARAKALAARVQSEAQGGQERIGRVYALLYQRSPTAAELQLGLEFLRGEGDGLPKWQQYAQVLLGAQEFLYVY